MQLKALMATKNFLFSRESKLVNLILVFVLVAGCEGLQRRSDTKKGATPTATATPKPMAGPTPPQPAPTPTPMGVPTAPAKDSFIEREAPKVGLILGPGAMKAYAHLGVLKELAKARIPVNHVVGLEWGAVIGGAYSMQGQVNEAEWKSFRLRENDIPGSAFLSTKIKLEAVQNLNTFLEAVFGNHSLDKNRIDFSCPTHNFRTGNMQWMNKGSAREAMTKCVPYLPYFSDNGGWMAEPFAIAEAAAYLRAKGANVIIFSNVLAQGDLFPSKLQNDQYPELVLWAEVRRALSRAKDQGIDWVINVNANDKALTDFSGRRALVDQGTKAAQEVVPRLVSTYGF